MSSSGMLRRVALVRTDVSEELSASIIRVTRIGELGTTLAHFVFLRSVRRLLVTTKHTQPAHRYPHRTRRVPYLPIHTKFSNEFLHPCWTETLFLVLNLAPVPVTTVKMAVNHVVYSGRQVLFRKNALPPSSG
jgi:hypothetical protein